ncbi:MAG: MlaD family protein [Muribaculaceae bacterium]|nr:MlaD family protein [Muribaculaceae bacterium]
MKKQFAIGLSVIVALLVLVFGINYLKGINMFKATNYYTASYTNVAGLAQSAPVMLNGYKVGIVRDIRYEYDNPGHVLVELSLDKELHLPEGTEAVIASDMLGTASVELHMGTSDRYIKVGSRIPGSTAAGLMDNLSGNMLPAIIGMLPKIDSILVSLNAVVANPALTSSVERLDKVMANLETSSRQLNTFMASMPAIANDTRGITGNLYTMSTDLTDMASKLNKLPLDSTMQNVYEASASLKVLMEQMNDPNSTLGALMNDRALYNNLNNSAASLDSLLKDVKQNPKRYINIKVF